MIRRCYERLLETIACEGGSCLVLPPCWVHFKKKIQGAEPLASVFLKHWLENRKKGSVFKFDAPLYLKKNKRVREVQQYHRNVFLTQKKARVGKSEKWAGVVPRFQGIGYSKWRVGSPLPMHYQSLCDIAPSLVDLIMIQRGGTDAERDLMTSLRGFQLHSEVNLFGNLQASGLVKIRFASWRCKVLDTYDWNYNEYFTVPNPDFGSGASNAIQPKEESLRVYHLNAKRLEDAGLAAPYVIESNLWSITDNALLSSENVNSKKNLS